MRTVTMTPSCPRVGERTAGGPVSAALMRGEAWREDAAGDIRFRIAEAMLLPQHHPAPVTLVQVASSALVANMKISVKGKVCKRSKGEEKWKRIRTLKERFSLAFIK